MSSDTVRKKLIEVALPLPEINDASAYDKMPGVGPHPKGIHHWWARLPLPTARAILFASVVDDPEAHPEKWPTVEAQNAERERLFDILRRMMAKKLHEAPKVYAEARAEMLKHCNGKLPSVFDPFAGGGSIPLEANRLGFEALAGDLNPVAVLLNKCNLEIAPRWCDTPPINPEDRAKIGGDLAWTRLRGLAADIRYYGSQVRAAASKRIGHLYPPATLPEGHGGKSANVVAWLWARTVPSPNPAARGTAVPLISTYWLSSRSGSEAWLEPLVDAASRSYSFRVHNSKPRDRSVVGSGTKVGRGGFQCILTGAPIAFDYIRAKGRDGQIGRVLLAAVVEARRGRLYVQATAEQLTAACPELPDDYPITDLPDVALGFRIQNYGIRQHWQMFTERQLVAIVTLSDAVKDIAPKVKADALCAGLSEPQALEYVKSVVTFLALALNRTADYNNAFNRWRVPNPAIMNLFSVQALPMVWDFVEANTLGSAIGSWLVCVEREADCVATIIVDNENIGKSRQSDAATGGNVTDGLLISTDPPYYDNIGYAALSDFFYIWLRRTVGDLYRDIFGTVLVPKAQELTAAPERFGGDKLLARNNFESGFRRAFSELRKAMDEKFPLTVYYAFKQADEIGLADEDSDAVDLTTGWETLLEALVSSGFQITGTWPVRASQAWRMRAMGSNALSSYIVLACRPRPVDTPATDRRTLLRELKRELPPALRHLQQGNIAPVDLAQAALGPGMAIYSRYSRILGANGSQVSVRAALREINRVLDETLAAQDGDLDADTRFCVAWFEQFGSAERDYGEAEVLFTAKNTSFAGLERAGVVVGGGGKVRLKRREELDPGWNPRTDSRLVDWECAQHLVRTMTAKSGGGVMEAAGLVVAMGPARAENARVLAYRLFTVSERKGWSEEALAYNILVTSWAQIQSEAAKLTAGGPVQSDLAL